ncbi:uncharacterized protein TNCV_3387931 [Trichonephila clavipes]|nr:uncharacterized protein TNCV_3387931 [Trichonephila clavipes]
MRSIGRGVEAGRMFCDIMNLPQPATRFSPYGKRILNTAKLVYEDLIQKAVKEANCENEGNKNIAVAVDGTWQKRGYTSLNGVVTVTSIDTGKDNARYITYLGDDDCKAFDAVKKKNIYGDEYPIEKLECVCVCVLGPCNEAHGKKITPIKSSIERANLVRRYVFKWEKSFD